MDFTHLRSRGRETVQEYFALLQAASDAKARERWAACQIQKLWRMYRARKAYQGTQYACLLIQRNFRKYRDRCRTNFLFHEREKQGLGEFFDACAAVIQKYYRGYWSRKYLQSFYGRKRFVGKLEQESEMVKTALREHEQRQQAEEQRKKEQERRKAFDSLTSQLHHLVSTRHIPGIFNPPYADIPKAYDKPIEQHLRDSFKPRLPLSIRVGPGPRRRLRRLVYGEEAEGAKTAKENTQHVPVHRQKEFEVTVGETVGAPSRPLLSVSASKGRLQPIQGPFAPADLTQKRLQAAQLKHRTVRQDAPYDAEEREKRMEARLKKLTRVAPYDFAFKKAQPTEINPAALIGAQEMNTRPKFATRQDYAALPRIQQPFLTAVPTGKLFKDYEAGL
uniref:Uncharacterized protein n=1 Tax=Chromera velia CCMP2878 TaxID=1169474 RepID=A0A0G4G4T7_9ALVE|eukprot:Cvel_20253.t1-p1 / transcript=Cvel_20253.t1 / gene=Cvel_20253 / organism=Chromera_velia_CCMP2878 / gene_product=Spermatogenesis-associated protein 17, putative / transcript_product=Spermatogenesis-associated protein 17, putative / location=Cvel_scaffold1806:12528-13697(+) / protein_length=390 / sequence_SO=supercontig / SO=protein_coding / is_pseudo=false